MVSNNLEKVFSDLLHMTREYDTAPDWAHGLKLGEECGEVQECILKDNGFLDHKTLKEDVLHEVADVFNTSCALLTSHYPDLTPAEIMQALTSAMIKKGAKYAKVLEVPVEQVKRSEGYQGVLDNVVDAVADLEGDADANALKTLVQILKDHNMDGL